MNQAVSVAAAAVLGLVIGYGTHLLNQRLAAAEEEATEPALPMERLWAPVLDAGLLGYTAYRFGATSQALLVGAVIVVLVQVLVFDARHRLILNRVIYPAILLALLVAPVNPLLTGSVGERVITAVAGALVGGGLFFILVVATGGGVGLGDAKLAFFMGAVLGFFPIFTSPILRALLYGIILGGVIAVLLLVSRRRGMRDYIPYGPYLCLGAILVLLFPCGLPGPGGC
ncbi:MAG: A24 family peptidase [Candidatus Dormiibacterota bacterium]